MWRLFWKAGMPVMVMLEYVDAVAIWHIGIYSLIHQSAMGFAIGASSLRFHSAPHGLLWGILFGPFLGTVMGTGVSLRTYYSSRRGKILSLSRRSFVGRGMTFSFCRKGDIITLH